VGLLLHHQCSPAAVQVHAAQMATGLCAGLAAAVFCYAFACLLKQ
jgi:hypothetical protein